MADTSITDKAPKCQQCGRTLAEYLTRPWSMRCRRCQAYNRADVADAVKDNDSAKSK